MIFISNFKLKNKGFTLIEIIVAVGLFTVVTFISIGAILSIFDANRRSQSSKSVVDNLNYTVESMARTIRFGSDYHCDSNTGGSLTSPLSCLSGGTRLAVRFVDNTGTYTIVYRWAGGLNDPIEKSVDGGSTYTAITAPEVKIQRLRFYAVGTTSGDTAQPYVLAVIKGYVGNKLTSQSAFTIQTVMSQRSLDI